MKNVWTALGALAAGAAVMALSDPAQGARRREYLRRRIALAAHDAVEAMESAGRQAEDRLQGAMQTVVQDGQGAVGQAVDRVQDAARLGQDAGLRLLQRIQALAREGRSRLSARLDRDAAVEPWRPGLGLSLLTAASGIVVGAAAMFLLDPQQGRRRLALARDQAKHLGRSAIGFTDVGLRDLGHRARGLAAQTTSRLRRDTADDVVLVERVRAALGRVVSHPHAIWVTAGAGCVTVGGAVLAAEREPLLKCARLVHGVHEVRDALEPHDSALHVPALQGGRSRNGRNAEYMQQHWAPGPRLLALAGGTALALYGASRRGLPGLLAGAAGASLALRAASNERLRRTAWRVAGRQDQGLTAAADTASLPSATEEAGRLASEPARAQPWQPAGSTAQQPPRGSTPLH
jgi:osmotically-inducible protein OsmY